MKAIPQVHDGILYRSRTEARWAEFFTLAGLPFEYEAEGFDLDGEWYVPDFKLWHGVHFEVKGAAPTDRERRVASRLAAASRAPVVIASGNPGASSLCAFGVGETSPSACFLVEEFRREDGAWVAQRADGGGWAFPLRGDLVNCSATGAEHSMLAVAGRLQFRPPDARGVAPEFRAVGDLVGGIVANLARGR